MWETVPFLERLVRVARVIAWGRRGTGLSDPVMRVPALDERVDDIEAVLDASSRWPCTGRCVFAPFDGRRQAH